MSLKTKKLDFIIIFQLYQLSIYAFHVTRDNINRHINSLLSYMNKMVDNFMININSYNIIQNF